MSLESTATASNEKNRGGYIEQLHRVRSAPRTLDSCPFSVILNNVKDPRAKHIGGRPTSEFHPRESGGASFAVECYRFPAHVDSLQAQNDSSTCIPSGTRPANKPLTER